MDRVRSSCWWKTNPRFACSSARCCASLAMVAWRPADAKSAIPILASKARLDLMITDVGLPVMNGRQLAEIARQHRPELKVLFVTGYAEHATTRAGFLDAGMDIVIKPFALDALAIKSAKCSASRPTMRPGDRHRCGDPGGICAGKQLKDAGYTDFFDPGAGGRRRRHLVSQQLPRLQVRRAIASVLLLLRIKTGLGPSPMPARMKSATISRNAFRPSVYATICG